MILIVSAARKKILMEEIVAKKETCGAKFKRRSLVLKKKKLEIDPSVSAKQ